MVIGVAVNYLLTVPEGERGGVVMVYSETCVNLKVPQCRGTLFSNHSTT